MAAKPMWVAKRLLGVMQLLDEERALTGSDAEEFTTADVGPVGDLETFVAEMFPRLRGVLLLRGFSADEADELAQEALVRVVQHWPRVQRTDSPAAWTFRTVHNLASSRLRRLRVARRYRRDLRPEPESEPDTADAVAVRAAVASLPARQRAAVALRYFAGLSVNETAVAMKCAPGTVKALCSQGLASLRSQLVFDDGDFDA